MDDDDSFAIYQICAFFFLKIKNKKKRKKRVKKLLCCQRNLASISLLKNKKTFDRKNLIQQNNLTLNKNIPKEMINVT